MRAEPTGEVVWAVDDTRAFDVPGVERVGYAENLARDRRRSRLMATTRAASAGSDSYCPTPCASVQPSELDDALELSLWGPYQTRVLALSSLAIALEGFDLQLLAFATPALSATWRLPRAAFAVVFAVGIGAMIVGNLICGWLADRVGRRRILIGSVVLFGAATLATPLASGVLLLALLRLATGFGAGGTLPSATSLIAEYTPARYRSAAVTISNIAIPIGGVACGLAASVVLPLAGWRGLFLVGGLLPLFACGLLLVYLPESPGYLLASEGLSPRLDHLLGRMGLALTPSTASAPACTSRRLNLASFCTLFNKAWRSDTLLLAASLFCSLFGSYLLANWLPSLLAKELYGGAAASMGLVLYNAGTIVGSLSLAAFVARLGTRPMAVLLSAGAATTCLVGANVAPLSLAGMLGLLTIVGATLGSLQVLMYPLAAQVYPVEVRATGLGTVIAFGRLGAVGSSFIGPLAIDGGHPQFFAILASAVASAGLFVFFVRRHVPIAHKKSTKPVASTMTT